jgi:hypothetical protein
MIDPCRTGILPVPAGRLPYIFLQFTQDCYIRTCLSVICLGNVLELKKVAIAIAKIPEKTHGFFGDSP